MNFDEIPTVGPEDKTQKDFYVDNRHVSLQAALDVAPKKGDYLEFGVYKGECARAIVKRTPNRSKLHLFDSFEGLPETWIPGRFEKGSLAVAEEDIPVFKSKKVVMHKGWFEDTVPGYSKSKAIIGFIHIDCDLYSSTKTVLDALESRIGKGTVILFDEFMGYNGWQNHEYKAFQEFIERTGKQFEYIHKSNYSQMCVKFL